MKQLLSAALVGGLMSVGPAQAQSSATIYGTVDMSVRYVKNEGAGRVTSLSSGGNSASRLGYRAREDLGGGLSAGFNLESGLSADTGTIGAGGTFFDRRSILSLSSAGVGEVRLGRDYTPAYVAWSRLDPFSYVNVAGTGALISGAPLGRAIGPIRAAFGPLPGGAANPNTLVRASDSVQYLLPPGLLKGLEGQLMLSAREGQTPAAGGAQLTALRLGYAAGDLTFNAVVTRIRNDLAQGRGLQDDVLGGSYDFGPVELSAAWRRFALRDARETHTLLAAVVPVGNGQFKFSWHRIRFDGRVGTTGIDGNGADQVSLGYLHDLSKRTALYTHVSRVNNRGAATYAVASVGPTGILPGGRSVGFEAGVRHNF